MRAWMVLSGSLLPGIGLVAAIAGSTIAEPSAPGAEPPPARRAAVPAEHLLTRIHVEIPLQSFERYVRDADEIVRGVVLSRTPVFPERGVAYTEYELAALSTVKGRILDRFLVRVGGARSDHSVVEVVGAPRFAEGQEVLLFLVEFADAATGRAYWGIRGLDHGTYVAVPEGAGGTRVAGVHAAGERSLEELELRALETYGRVGVAARRGEEER